MQARDFTLGVFQPTVVGTTNVLTTGVDQPHTLLKMFKKMTLEMNQALENSNVPCKVLLFRTESRIVFSVIHLHHQNTLAEQLLNVSYDTFITLNDCLIKSGTASKQVLLLFFQVISMFAYEVVTNFMADHEVDKTVMELITVTVKQMIVMMFLTIPASIVCWVNLFQKMLEELSADRTAIRKYVERCQHMPNKSSSEIETQKLYADSVAQLFGNMQKKKTSDFITRLIAHIDSLEIKSASFRPAALESMSVIQIPSGLQDTSFDALHAPHHTLNDLQPTSGVQIDSDARNIFLKERTIILDSETTFANQKVGIFNDSHRDAVQAIRQVRAREVFSDERVLGTGVQTIQQDIDTYSRQHVEMGNLLTSAQHDAEQSILLIDEAEHAVPLSGKQRDVLSHSVQLLESSQAKLNRVQLAIDSFNNPSGLLHIKLPGLIKHGLQATVENSHHEWTELEVEAVNLKHVLDRQMAVIQISKQHKVPKVQFSGVEILSDQNKYLINMVNHLVNTDMLSEMQSYTNNPWISAPTRNTGTFVSTRGHVGVGTNELYLHYFLRLAYIRSEQVYRSFPSQIFMRLHQFERDGYHSIQNMLYDTSMHDIPKVSQARAINSQYIKADKEVVNERIRFPDEKLWIHICLRTLKHVVSIKDGGDFHLEQINIRNIVFYMHFLNLFGNKTFKYGNSNSVVMNKQIRSNKLKTLLFLNGDSQSSGLNPRFNVKDHSIESDGFIDVTYRDVRETIEKKDLYTLQAPIESNKMIVGPLHGWTDGSTNFKKGVEELVSKHMVSEIHSLDKTPMLIMGYGASGSGKTTCLFGLAAGGRNQPQEYGVLQYILENLPKNNNDLIRELHVQGEQFYHFKFLNTVAKQKNMDYVNEQLSSRTMDLQNTLRTLFAEDTETHTNILPGNIAYSFTFIREGDTHIWHEKETNALIEDVLRAHVESPALRKIAPTFLNNQSSRSHVIMTFDFPGLEKLYIADFAGVENLPSCDEGNTGKMYRLVHDRAGKEHYNHAENTENKFAAQFGGAVFSSTRSFCSDTYNRLASRISDTFHMIPAERDSLNISSFRMLIAALHQKKLIASSPLTTLYVQQVTNLYGHTLLSEKHAYNPPVIPLTYLTMQLRAQTHLELLLWILYNRDAAIYGSVSCMFSADDFLKLSASQPRRGSLIMDPPRLPKNKAESPFTGIIAITNTVIMDALLKDIRQEYENSRTDPDGFLSYLERALTVGRKKYTPPVNHVEKNLDVLAYRRSFVNFQALDVITPSINHTTNNFIDELIEEFIKSKARGSYWQDFLKSCELEWRSEEHGKAICRFRVAEGNIINESLDQVRQEFLLAYSTGLLANVQQNEMQCKVLNNQDVGDNNHNLEFIKVDREQSRPQPFGVTRKIKQILATQPNTFVLGVFNQALQFNNPPLVDYLQCSGVIQEFKYLSKSELSSQLDYINQKTQDTKRVHSAVKNSFLEAIRMLLPNKVEDYTEADKKRQPVLDKARELANRANSLNELRSLILFQTEINSNTQLGTLEFLDQASKLFSTNQTFVFDVKSGLVH